MPFINMINISTFTNATVCVTLFHVEDKLLTAFYLPKLSDNMMGFLPLGSKVTAGLSVAEFLTGVAKASNPRSKYSMLCFLVFGMCEMVLGLLISASIIVQVTTLKYWYSKALYSMAVTSDFYFLFLDLFWAGRWIWTEEYSSDIISQRVKWYRDNLKHAACFALSAALILSTPMVLLVLLFGRLNFSSSDISVSELFDSATAPPSFWISFAGFIFLILSFVFSFLFVLSEVFCEDGRHYTLRNFLYFSFIATVAVGLPMIIGGGLHVSKHFVRSYAFISLTTFPPVFSFAVTFVKLETVSGLQDMSET